MRRAAFLAFIAMAACVGMVHVAVGQQPNGGTTLFYPSQQLTSPEVLLHGCCDDYCRKPMPCLNDFCATPLGDVYCRKPCPCVPCFPSYCGHDCYCRKPYPDLCRPLAADFFTCARPEAGSFDAWRSGRNR
jgi:hypothetical protein